MHQLCDNNSGHGALRCNYHETACKGAVSDDCYPNNVWSGDYKTAGSSYYNGNLNSGTFYATTGNYNDYTFAFGVRCVLGFEPKISFINRPRQAHKKKAGSKPDSVSR